MKLGSRSAFRSEYEAALSRDQYIAYVSMVTLERHYNFMVPYIIIIFTKPWCRSIWNRDHAHVWPVVEHLHDLKVH